MGYQPGPLILQDAGHVGGRAAFDFAHVDGLDLLRGGILPDAQAQAKGERRTARESQPEIVAEIAHPLLDDVLDQENRYINDHQPFDNVK